MKDIGNWTVKQLKDELRRRGAPLSGKKADLVERLLAYESNNNFRVELALETVLPDFEVPAEELFKDVNANTQLPGITRLHVDLFFKMYGKKVDTAEAMYAGSFLGFVRHCQVGEDHYFKSLVHAQMFKKVTYAVHSKVGSDGRVEAAHCECAAGGGGSAHCKHVGVTLLGVVQMAAEGRIKTRQTCTQQLQNFHRPKKAYQGTPLKSAAMCHSSRGNSAVFDPRPLKFRDSKVQERIHNLCAPFQSSAMPLKHLLPPANPYGVEWDHPYSKLHPRLQFLKSVYLFDVSPSAKNLSDPLIF